MAAAETPTPRRQLFPRFSAKGRGGGAGGIGFLAKHSGPARGKHADQLLEVDGALLPCTTSKQQQTNRTKNTNKDRKAERRPKVLLADEPTVVRFALGVGHALICTRFGVVCLVHCCCHGVQLCRHVDEDGGLGGAQVCLLIRVFDNVEQAAVGCAPAGQGARGQSM